MTQTPKRRAREDTRGRLYRLARPADTPHTGSSDKSLPEPAPKPYNPAKTTYLTQRGASIAHQQSCSSKHVFDPWSGGCSEYAGNAATRAPCWWDVRRRRATVTR